MSENWGHSLTVNSEQDSIQHVGQNTMEEMWVEKL